MAQLADDGRPVSSGKGKAGVERAWKRLAAWQVSSMPAYAARIKRARRGQ